MRLFLFSGMSSSTDIVVLLALSVLTLIAAVRHWQKATPSRLCTASTKELTIETDGNGDDDPNKDRSFGGEKLIIFGETIETNAIVSGLGCCCCSVDWTPVPFTYPPVTPVTEALDQIPLRPYRPYKPGRYQ